MTNLGNNVLYLVGNESEFLFNYCRRIIEKIISTNNMDVDFMCIDDSSNLAMEMSLNLCVNETPFIVYNNQSMICDSSLSMESISGFLKSKPIKMCWFCGELTALVCSLCGCSVCGECSLSLNERFICSECVEVEYEL